MALSEGGDSSTKLRREGNSHFKSAQAGGIGYVLKKYRLENAIQKYSRALQCADTDDLRSSACKNLGMANRLLANTMQKRNASERKLIRHYYKEMIKNFDRSYNFGRICKCQEWCELLQRSTIEALDEAFKSEEETAMTERLGTIEIFISKIAHDDIVAAIGYFNLANVLFGSGVTLLADGIYKDAISAFSETSRPLQEFNQLSRGTSIDPYTNDARIMEQDLLYQLATAESIQAVEIGDNLLDSLLRDEEELNVDQLYSIVDWYKQGLLLTRELAVEREAIAASRLGKIFGQTMMIKSKGRKYCQLAVELAHSLTPQIFTNDEWYKSATTTLKSYQEESVQYQQAKLDDERKEYVKELKEEMEKLKTARDKFYGDASYNEEDITHYIIEEFPPKKTLAISKKSVIKEMAKAEKKKLFIKIILHYHPDKQDVEKHGRKWQILCEEIVKIFTNIYEAYKL